MFRDLARLDLFAHATISCSTSERILRRALVAGRKSTIVQDMRLPQPVCVQAHEGV